MLRLRLRRVAVELHGALPSLGQPEGGRAVPTPPGDWRDAGAPVPLDVLYDRACITAVGVANDPDAALDDLELAVGDNALRELAETDPWFAELRDGSGPWSDRWWTVVGAADAPPFTDLPLLRGKGPALRGRGIIDARDLRDATEGRRRRWQLARALDVPTALVTRWRALAELAMPDGRRAEELTPNTLALLLDVGIESRADLADRADPDDGATPLTAVREAAERAGVRAPDDLTLRVWRGIAEEPGATADAAPALAPTGAAG